MDKREALNQLRDGVIEYTKTRRSKTPIPSKIKELIFMARQSGASEDEVMEASQLSRPTIRRYGKKTKHSGRSSQKSEFKKRIRELKIVPGRNVARPACREEPLVEVQLCSGVKLSVWREMLDLSFLKLLSEVR